MRTPDLSSFHVIESRVKEAICTMDPETKGLVGMRLEQVKTRTELALDATVRDAVSEIVHLLDVTKLIKEQQSARQEQECD